MAKIILERSYEPPIDEAQFGEMAQRIGSCLGANGATWLRSYLSADGRRSVCEFEAADAEKVRASFRAAGVAFERTWPAKVFASE